MIPKFKKNGYLPRGVHKTSLNKIKQRFSKGSVERKELFKGICFVVQLLRKHRNSIKRFLLNGSYVTSKEFPEDFDCILILKRNFNFNSPEAKQLRRSKKLFNGHILVAMEEDVDECHKLIDFFGHDRDGKSKGLVEVLL